MCETAEPASILLHIHPTHIVDRLILLSGRLMGAGEGRNALPPFADGDGKAPKREWCDRDPVYRLLDRIVAAAHS